MKNDSQSRKWQLTINNPLDNDFTHDKIKEILATFKSLKYYCLADESGSTHHTHIYVAFENGVRFSSLKNKFPTAHFEMAKGTSQQNRDYISKEGKWANDKKHGTRIAGTFEEWGEIPVERQGVRTDLESVYDMLKDGLSNIEILETMPDQLLNIDRIERVRQELKENEYRNTFRNLEVTFVYGDTETGKTRHVMETFGYSNVYRISDYKHPFDRYANQDVLVFDEFTGQIKITDMNQYLEGYPLELGARYSNKVACYTKVFIISNLTLNELYNHQTIEEAILSAFKRRIHYIKHFKDNMDTTVTITTHKNGVKLQKIDTIEVQHPKIDKYLPIEFQPQQLNIDDFNNE